MEIIATDKAPAALGPYSQGTVAGGLVFTAGQIPVNPATGDIPDTVEGQARQALSNVRAILDKAGPVEVLNVNVYLADMADFATVNKVYAEFFTEPYPARTCVGVASLPKGVKMEIAAIAIRKN